MKARKRVPAISMAIVALLVLVVLFTGCNPAGSEDTFGSLTISLPSSSTDRGISSNLVTEIDEYEITVTYQANTTYTQTETVKKSVGSATFESLVPGAWTINVQGFNASGILIAQGSADATVEVGKTKSVSIHLVPSEGAGTLEVDVSWTENLVDEEDVTITVTATRMGASDDPVSVPMLKATGGASSTGQITLEKGTYFIKATFKDDSNAYNDGRVVVVQILADGTTEASFMFPLSVGGLSIGIEDPDFSMLDLTIAGLGDTQYVAKGSTVTLTVEGAQIPDSYQWYENGELLSDENSASLVVPVDAYRTYSFTCVVVSGIKYDSATVEFTGVEHSEEYDTASDEKYGEALTLIDTMLVTQAPAVDTRYLYDTLTESVSLNPNNMDAVFALGMFDIMKFLLDDEVQVLMREGIGFTNYPGTEQELYADILTMMYGFVPNGFNKFFTEYGYGEGEDYYTVVLPLLSGYLTSDGKTPAYLLQIFSNLVESGYDVDDVFDGILDSLGRSFERTVNNINSLSNDARMHVLSIDDTSYSIAKSEAQLLASQLYSLRALASIFNAIELGFDIQNILDGLSYNITDNSVDFDTPATSPMANGFLQADETGMAYIEAAKTDILTANTLMIEALDAIAARTSDDADLLVNPDGAWLDDVNDGWTSLDPTPSWDELMDAVAVVKTLLLQEKASIEAEGGTQIVIPYDIGDYYFYQDEEPYDEWYDYGALFSTYADPLDWPTQADMSLETGLNAIAFDLGIFFTREFNLLATLLQIDPATGEPVMYRYNESTNSFAVATNYVDGVGAYVKIPDATIGGIIDKADVPVSWSTLEEQFLPAPFAQQPIMIREEGNAVAFYILEYAFTPEFSYPLSYHALQPKETIGTATGYFLTDFENLMTGESVVTEYDIDVTSTGSFWLGIIEAIEFTMQYSWLDRENLYELHAPLNDSKENAYVLDENIEMSFYWWSENMHMMPESAWFKITPDRAATYCIEPDIWNGTTAILHKPDNSTQVLEAKHAGYINAGETYYVEFTFESGRSDYYYDIIWYEEDANVGNYDDDLAAVLKEGDLFAGVTGRRGDYFTITPMTDQITIEFEKIYPEFYSHWLSWNDVHLWCYASLGDDYYSFYEDIGLGTNTFSVMPGCTYTLSVRNMDYLRYTVQWDDSGTLPTVQ
nr:hypothetical protein [uncultured Sphaerochaeta sp.]